MSLSHIVYIILFNFFVWFISYYTRRDFSNTWSTFVIITIKIVIVFPHIFFTCHIFDIILFKKMLNVFSYIN